MTVENLSTDALIGRPHKPHFWPEPFFTADYKRFNHPNAQLQTHRRSLPLYGGELDLSVWCLTRDDTHKFEDVAASWFAMLHNHDPQEPLTQTHLNEHIYIDPDHPTALPHSTHTQALLWELADVGCLMWDWEGATAAQDPSYQRRYHFQRVFLFVSPQTTANDIGAQHAKAAQALQKLVQPPNTMARHAFRDLIQADLTRLTQICVDHGTYGDAFLPNEPIERWWVPRNDGNTRHIVFQTPSSWMAIAFTTS